MGGRVVCNAAEQKLPLISAGKAGLEGKRKIELEGSSYLKLVYLSWTELLSLCSGSSYEAVQGSWIDSGRTGGTQTEVQCTCSVAECTQHVHCKLNSVAAVHTAHAVYYTLQIAV